MECVRLCDEIILWFSVGTYVERAMELKQIYEPLTPDQLEKAEHKEKYVENLNKVAREFGSVGEETSALMEAGMGENAVSEMPEDRKITAGICSGNGSRTGGYRYGDEV